ncbi:hypothetical protein D3C79_769060 [compost metagenome]
MNGRTEKHPGLLRRQLQPAGNHRVEDHRQGRQRRHADHGKQRGALFLRVMGQGRGQGQSRRSPADRRGTAGKHAEQALKAQGTCRHHRNQDGHHHQDHHQRHRFPAQAGDLAQGNAHAQQRHPQAQHCARGKFNPGLATAIGREKVQGHAQQQGKQHHRGIVVLTEKAGRRRGDQADDKARRQFPGTVVDGGNCDHAHWPGSLHAKTMNSCSPWRSTG